MYIQGVFKKHDKCSHKIKKTKYINKIFLLPLKIISINYNILLTTFVKLPETVVEGCGNFYTNHKYTFLLAVSDSYFCTNILYGSPFRFPQFAAKLYVLCVALLYLAGCVTFTPSEWSQYSART